MVRNCFLCVLAFLTCFTAPAMGSIIKKPPAKITEMAYKDLPCTEQDQAYIYEIISMMGEKGKLALLFQQNHLREIGSYIVHVHPLKFLATVLKEPHLKSLMPYIWDDYFKKKGLLYGSGASGGLIDSLIAEERKGKLHIHLKDFAADVGVSAEMLKSYAEVHDWENMVFFLIHS